MAVPTLRLPASRIDSMYKLLAALVPVLVLLSIALVIAVNRTVPKEYGIDVDVNSAKQLAQLVAAAAPDVPLAPDGGIDVFRLVRAATDDSETWVELTRSARFDFGPTREDIESGDYSRFPYERWQGPLPDETVPVFWDHKPDPEGMRVVGFSDGMSDVFDPAEWEDIRPN